MSTNLPKRDKQHDEHVAILHPDKNHLLDEDLPLLDGEFIDKQGQKCKSSAEKRTATQTEGKSLNKQSPPKAIQAGKKWQNKAPLL